MGADAGMAASTCTGAVVGCCFDESIIMVAGADVGAGAGAGAAIGADGAAAGATAAGRGAAGCAGDCAATDCCRGAGAAGAAGAGAAGACAGAGSSSDDVPHPMTIAISKSPRVRSRSFGTATLVILVISFPPVSDCGQLVVFGRLTCTDERDAGFVPQGTPCTRKWSRGEGVDRGPTLRSDGKRKGRTFSSAPGVSDGY